MSFRDAECTACCIVIENGDVITKAALMAARMAAGAA